MSKKFIGQQNHKPKKEKSIFKNKHYTTILGKAIKSINKLHWDSGFANKKFLRILQDYRN